MKAEAQQRKPGYTDQARGWGVVRGDKCAYLTVLKSAYTSRLFPALVHSRNTSSGRKKATANVPCSLALSSPIPTPRTVPGHSLTQLVKVGLSTTGARH